MAQVRSEVSAAIERAGERRVSTPLRRPLRWCPRLPGWEAAGGCRHAPCGSRAWSLAHMQRSDVTLPAPMPHNNTTRGSIVRNLLEGKEGWTGRSMKRSVCTRHNNNSSR